MNLHPKVAAPLLANAIVVVVIWIVTSENWTRTPTPEVTAALVLIVGFVVGYLTPSSTTQP